MQKQSFVEYLYLSISNEVLDHHKFKAHGPQSTPPTFRITPYTAFIKDQWMPFPKSGWLPGEWGFPYLQARERS